MKRMGIARTTAFLMILGMAAPAYAWQEKPEKQEEKSKPQRPQEQAKPPQPQEQAKPERQQERPAKPEQQAKPEARQQSEGSAKKPPEQAKEQQRQPQQNSRAKTEPTTKPQQQVRPQPQARAQQGSAARQPEQVRVQQQQQGRSGQAPERTQQAVARQRAQPALRLSARGSGRIPDQRFHSNFGVDHHFRVGNPVLVGGYSRFQYGGYWFGFVEPWPADWYYTDDVYVDYVDDGYYMYNPYHPGVRFAISVVM